MWMDIEIIVLTEISQPEKGKNHMVSTHRKQKATSEQTKQTNSGTDNRMLVGRRTKRVKESNIW